MALRNESAEGRTLARLLEITHDILQAQEIGPAFDSIARGLSEIYGFRYVSIVASDGPGDEMYRRVITGFPPEVARERLGEHIPREAALEMLNPQFEVVPNCYYMPAEHEQVWPYNIYTGDQPLEALRASEAEWHERDSLCLVLSDRDGAMLGYISVDGPLDNRVPTRNTLREMQLFVNLASLAITNARAHAAEIERRKLLEATSRAQSEFFAVVSHEVRSPLAAIRGATALLDTHFESIAGERRTELLRVLTSSTARLWAIFEDFLLLSRMDAGKLTLRLERVDSIAIVEESVSRMESEHPDREFRTLYLQPLPPVFADAGRVVQVLTNLLSNAAKYSTPGSVIVIEMKAHDDRVVFTVKNEGPGLAESERDKVFTRFGRLSGESDSSIGLGLYICSELVSMMGGKIGYESEPNKVTAFWFALPRWAGREKQ